MDDFNASSTDRVQPVPRQDSTDASWFRAVLDGNVKAVEEMIRDGVDVNSVDADGRTALHHVTSLPANHSSTMPLLALLLSAPGVRVSALYGVQGETPLHLAARRPSGTPLVRVLLSAGGDLGGVLSDGATPLHCACQAENTSKTVKLLVRRKAALEATRCGGPEKSRGGGVRGITSLHDATEVGAVRSVRILLEARANADAPLSNGCTPLHTAAGHGYLDIVEALLSHGARSDLGASPGGLYSTRGSGSRGQGWDAGQGRTALHLAVRAGHAGVVARLLGAPDCDVNAAETLEALGGNAPLASINDEEGDQIPEFSPPNGGMPPASPQPRRRPRALLSGYTALHWAVENSDLPIARLLLSHGADPNLRAAFDAHSGVAALHLAAQDGRADIARALLASPGCDPDPRKCTLERESITPMHQARLEIKI